MTDDDIKTARELCADPPEQDSIDPPTCPACGDEYILDNDNGTHGHMMCDPCGAEAFDKARTLVPALLDALAEARAGRAERGAAQVAALSGWAVEGVTLDAKIAELTADLAAAKAALAEAIAIIESVTTSVPHLHVHFAPTLAALKAKVRP